MTVIDTFDKTLQLTHEWINEIAQELGTDDKRKVFQGLRATLHVLRDRLTIGEAANLGAELPILLAGFYFEGWKPEGKPIKTRSKEDFITALEQHFHSYFKADGIGFEPEQFAKAVFRVMSDRIPTGEMTDVVGILNTPIKELFPEAVRA